MRAANRGGSLPIWTAAFVCGLVFGLGLSLSGMIDPAKVLAFFDVAGSWDPSLAFVMGGALAVTLPGYALLRRRQAPVFFDRFHWPGATAIDARLLGGAALFGIGWGLVGFCPGPALAALGTLAPEAALFMAAMIAGMALARFGPAAFSGNRATRRSA